MGEADEGVDPGVPAPAAVATAEEVAGSAVEEPPVPSGGELVIDEFTISGIDLLVVEGEDAVTVDLAAVSVEMVIGGAGDDVFSTTGTDGVEVLSGLDVARALGTSSPSTICTTVAIARASAIDTPADVVPNTASSPGSMTAATAGSARKPSINDVIVIPSWAPER